MITDDVLEVLRDPLIQKIYFSVGPIIVTDGQYDRVYHRVKHDEIHVSVNNVRGVQDDFCLYKPEINTIILNTGWTRSDVDHRALLLHECTHAVVDIEEIKVRRLYGEVAGYLAQFTYLLLYDPYRPEPSEKSSTPGSAESIYELGMRIVRGYELNGHKGYGASIRGPDIDELAQVINSHPKYADIKWDEVAVSDGAGTETYPIPTLRPNPYDDQDLFRSTHVTYENYVTNDDEILGLMTQFLNYTGVKKDAATKKLTLIFEKINQQSADKLHARLSFRVPSDKLSVRFNDAIPIGVKTDLLASLRMKR